MKNYLQLTTSIILSVVLTIGIVYFVSYASTTSYLQYNKDGTALSLNVGGDGGASIDKGLYIGGLNSAGNPVSSLIVANGNVGIGTTSPNPAYKLDINGALNAAIGSTIGNLSIGNSLAFNTNKFTVDPSGNITVSNATIKNLTVVGDGTINNLSATSRIVANGGFQINTNPAIGAVKPTCDLSKRGMLWDDINNAGDSISFCGCSQAAPSAFNRNPVPICTWQTLSTYQPPAPASPGG